MNKTTLIIWTIALLLTGLLCGLVIAQWSAQGCGLFSLLAGCGYHAVIVLGGAYIINKQIEEK